MLFVFVLFVCVVCLLSERRTPDDSEQDFVPFFFLSEFGFTQDNLIPNSMAKQQIKDNNIFNRSLIIALQSNTAKTWHDIAKYCWTLIAMTNKQGLGYLVGSNRVQFSTGRKNSVMKIKYNSVLPEDQP